MIMQTGKHNNKQSRLYSLIACLQKNSLLHMDEHNKLSIKTAGCFEKSYANPALAKQTVSEKAPICERKSSQQQLQLRWAKSRDSYRRIASKIFIAIRIASVRWRSYLPPKTQKLVLTDLAFVALRLELRDWRSLV